MTLRPPASFLRLAATALLAFVAGLWVTGPGVALGPASDDAAPPPSLGADADSVFTADGGTVRSADGLFEVSLPPGILKDPARLQISATEPQGKDSDVALEFQVALVSLADLRPVDAGSSIDLRVNLSDLPSGVESIQFSADGNQWQPAEWKYEIPSTSVTVAGAAAGQYRILRTSVPEAATVAEGTVDSKGGSIQSPDGDVELRFAPNAAEELLDVKLEEKQPTGLIGDLRPLRQFTLDALAVNRDMAEVHTFDQPVEITIRHSAEELAGLDPEQLKLYWLDETTGKWEAVPNQSVVGGTVSAKLNHFSVYATAAATYISGPGNILWHQADEHAGAATYSIPIEAPAGPGGFSIPPLALTYNSSRVDEMKSNQSVGSWAGIGWDVSYPSIRRDPTTNRYYLEEGAAFDEIVQTGTDTDGSTKWSTRNEFYQRIRSKANADGQHTRFVVTLKDGTQWRFGTQGTLDEPNDNWARWYWTWTGSWQRHYYRIDLSRIVDTHGNYADYTYLRNTTSYCPQGASNPSCQTNVQGVNLQYVYWGGRLGGDVTHRFRVFFALPTRSDPPICAGAEPLVYEIRRISAIKVQTLVSGSWNLARRYDLTYDPISGSVPACPLAGVLKLASVKQLGTDGDTTSPPPVPLATTTFTYNDRSVEYKNEANTCRSFTRPYLATADNGYGARTTFGYETKWQAGPAGSDPACSGSSNVATWTRNVVSSRAEDPDPLDALAAGVAPPMTRTYAYTTGPKYYFDPGLSPIDAEFRGFRQVVDTDSSGDSRTCRYYTTGTDPDTGFGGDVLTGHPFLCFWNEYGNPAAVKRVWNWWLSRYIAPSSNFVYLGIGQTYTDSEQRDLWYSYDAFGNLYTEEERVPTFYRRTTYSHVSNTTLWIVDRLAVKQVEGNLPQGGWGVAQKDGYLYDLHNSYSDPPDKGDLTTELRHDDSDVAHTLKSYLYDDWGNRTVVTTFRDPATSFYTESTYDSTYHAFLASETHTTNALPPVVLTTSYAYDFVLGKQTVRTDPNGQQFTTHYDKYGRQDYEVQPGDSVSNPTTVYEYYWDATVPNQTVTKRREVSGEATKILVSWEWQDGLRRTIQSRSEGPDCTADSVTDTTYDVVGQVATSSIPYWASNTGCVQGGYTTPSTSIGKTQYEYDGQGRETKTTQPNGGIKTTAYFGYSTATIDENGHKTENINDAYGRLVTVNEYIHTCLNPCGSNPFGAPDATTTFSYDVLDRQTGTTDAATPANVWTNTYNKLSFLTQTIDPDRGTWTYEYYDDGLLKIKRDARTPSAQTITYVYDSQGRISSKTYSGYATPPAVTYSYDTCELNCPDTLSKGRLTRVNDWAGTHKYKYDARGQVTREEHTIDSVAYSVSYDYDALGRVTATTYPDNEVVTGAFDDQGVLDTLTTSLGSSGYVTGTTNNAASMVTNIKYGNGVEVDYTYNETTDLRLTRIHAKKSGNLFDQTYGYDPLGQVQTVSDALEGQSGSTATIGYDERNRVHQVTGLPGVTANYSYSKIGNITAKQETGGAENGNFPSMVYGVTAGPHAVTTANIGGGGGSHTYTYDANGNLKQEYLNYVLRREYFYDAEGQAYAMATNESGPMITTTYWYGADGTAFKRVVAGSTVVYIAGIYEKDTVSGTITKYYQANGQRIAMRQGPNGQAGTLSYLTNDYLGSTALVTDASGALVNRTRYFPYGAIRTEEPAPGSSPTDKRFTGQRRETPTVYNYNARFYHTDIGRMPQADSIVPDAASPAAYNRYAYVVNNPVNMNDPTGWTYQWIHFQAHSKLKGAGQFIPFFPNDDTVVEHWVDAWYLYNVPCCSSAFMSWISYRDHSTNLCCFLARDCVTSLVCYWSWRDYTWKPVITVASSRNQLGQFVRFSYDSRIGGSTWAEWRFRLFSYSYYTYSFTYGAQYYRELLSSQWDLRIEKCTVSSVAYCTTQYRRS